MEHINVNPEALEYTLAAIRDLSSTYDRTEVAEYRGQLHVRTGRRVVAVFDYVNGWVRVNECHTNEQRARANEVLEILGSERRATSAEVPVPGACGATAVAELWAVPGGDYSDVVLTARTGREVFTLAYLGSELAAFYATIDQDTGEIIPQPSRTWTADNLRDISEGR